MRSLFWFITLFAVATGLALAVGLNTGYVLIVVAPWRIEISLVVFVIGLVLSVLVINASWRLLTHTLNLPSRIKAYRQRRARNRARSMLYQGLTAYFEGNYRKAERQAESALEAGESPALSAVVAARSAHEQHRFEVRDHLLERLAELGPETSLMHLTTKAELLLSERRSGEALETLREAHRSAPRNTRVNQLLLRALISAGSWRSVLDTVNVLEQLTGIDTLQALRVRRNAWQQLLRHATHHREDFLALWKSVPPAVKTDQNVARTGATHLIALGYHKEALDLIERALDREWDVHMAGLYGDCVSDSPVGQMEKAEKWLRDHPDSASLLLTLAKLCMRQSLWGKAEAYLDASLSLEATPEGEEIRKQLVEKKSASRFTARSLPEPGPEFGAV